MEDYIWFPLSLLLQAEGNHWLQPLFAHPCIWQQLGLMQSCWQKRKCKNWSLSTGSSRTPPCTMAQLHSLVWGPVLQRELSSWNKEQEWATDELCQHAGASGLTSPMASRMTKKLWWQKNSPRQHQLCQHHPSTPLQPTNVPYFEDTFSLVFNPQNHGILWGEKCL